MGCVSPQKGQWHCRGFKLGEKGETHPCFDPSHGLDHMQAMESSQQGARIGFHMFVVLGNELEQQPHLLLLNCLDEEAVIVRQEKGTA